MVEPIHVTSPSPARGESRQPFHPLEITVVVHVAVLAIFSAWAFGGNAYWSRLATAGLGSLGFFFTAAALLSSATRTVSRALVLRCLWPCVLLNGLVLASCLNPSFRAVVDGADVYYVQGTSAANFPSTARPDLSLQALWFFDAAYLSCFNLMLVVRQRRVLRWLLLALVANAVLLAAFGTMQKLLGATAPFFAAGKFRQPFFFASFLYHNHWGAYALLMITASIALVFHYARNARARDFWHTPGFSGLIAIGLLAMAIPLSGSRSATLLLGVLLLAALGQWCIRVFLNRARRPRALRATVVVSLVLLAGTTTLGYAFARPVIIARMQTTYRQLDRVRTTPSAATRVRLYRDTWHMVQQRPWFGWGLATYPTAFFLFNSQRFPHPITHPQVQVNFRDAHSDWLQSLAELGIIGTTLVGLCAIVPLWIARRSLGASWLSGGLWTGISIVLLYAAVEFPFGNAAVIVAFWLCFFSAVHYPRVESAAAAPQLA